MHRDIQPFAEYAVTPFVGVWIETLDLLICLVKKYVTPFVGVWIETRYQQFLSDRSQSHPSWVCGLKLSIGSFELFLFNVTPFVGVWIET